jgi:hypothetical protein
MKYPKLWGNRIASIPFIDTKYLQQNELSF